MKYTKNLIKTAKTAITPRASFYEHFRKTLCDFAFLFTKAAKERVHALFIVFGKIRRKRKEKERGWRERGRKRDEVRKRKWEGETHFQQIKSNEKVSIRKRYGYIGQVKTGPKNALYVRSEKAANEASIYFYLDLDYFRLMSSFFPTKVCKQQAKVEAVCLCLYVCVCCCGRGQGGISWFS